MRPVSSPRWTRFLHGGPLVEDDAVRALSREARRVLGQIWRRRAAQELCTSALFAQLDAELRLFGAAPEVLELSARAIVDEAFHSELCLRLAEVYLAEPAVIEPLPEPAAPTFPVCSPRVQRALFAVLHCAVNETLAVNYLSACLAEVQSDAAQRVLKELLADEVRHARIGWAVLASPELTAQDRDTIARFMPALLDVCVGAWLADTQTEYPDDLPRGHGCISHVGIARAVAESLDAVILPGLRHVQIDTTAASSWLQRGAFGRAPP